MAASARRTRQPLVPLGSASEPLSPTAARILEAAKRILADRGFAALTLEAIAAEAGVNKAATRYHFGSKAGLLEAVVDEIVLDECASMARDLSPAATLDERLDSFLDSVRRMAVQPSSFSGFFDILPHALRDRALRTRLVYLYEVWYAWNLEWLGLDAVDDTRWESLEGLGRLTAATIDGIAIQASIHGPSYDPEPTLRTLRHCLEAVLR
jgi:AcrR family transcriptional regulator